MHTHDFFFTGLIGAAAIVLFLLAIRKHHASHIVITLAIGGIMGLAFVC